MARPRLLSPLPWGRGRRAASGEGAFLATAPRAGSPPMSQPRLSITIIGGGASGVLLAAHLLRNPETDVRVNLIERRGRVGQGMAYSATQHDHILNVPASGMSAFA